MSTYNSVPSFVFTISLFILLSLFNQYNKNQIEILKNSLNKYQQEITKLETSIDKLKINSNECNQYLADIRADFSVLDEAIHADSKRRVLINKTRNAIKEIIKGINTKETRELTAVHISEIATAIVDNGDKYNVPITLILAVMRQESAFNTKAVSPVGAQGLMQVLPITADDIKGWINKPVYDAFKPAQNIQFGVYYLSRMLSKFNYDKSNAVKAYNAGPETIARYLNGVQQNLPEETINYETNVLKYTEEYRKYGIE